MMDRHPSRGGLSVMISPSHVDGAVSRCVVRDATRQEGVCWQRGEDLMRCKPCNSGPNTRARLHAVRPCAALTTQQVGNGEWVRAAWCDAMRCDAMCRKEGDLRFSRLLQNGMGGCTGQGELGHGTALALWCCGGTSRCKASTGTANHLADSRYRGTPAGSVHSLTEMSRPCRGGQWI